MKEEYLIVRCRNLHCGKFSYCKSNQKTKMCPYCGKRVDLSKIDHIYAENSLIARKLVQEFNKKLGEITEPEWYKNNE